MDLILDTNILIHYSRETVHSREIEKDYQLFDGKSNLCISVVTVGEIESLIKQLNLGQRRVMYLQNLMKMLFIIDINIQEIIDKYAEIDAFSQGKLPNQAKFSARNMGKNDLWISATASAYNLTLVTTDKDFRHLHNQYLNLLEVDLQQYKS